MARITTRAHERIVLIGLVATLGAMPLFASDTGPAEQWTDPFKTVRTAPAVSGDTLTIEDVLSLVAGTNPGLRAAEKRIEAAEGLVDQAGKRPNPELALEFEDVGWDAPGFKESEIGLVLSHELELWGKRGHRVNLAETEAEAARFETVGLEFDIYGAAVERFFALAHAQQQVELTREAVAIATAITGTTEVRVKEGAAPASELLLGQLELERVRLEEAQAEADLDIARHELASLWRGEASGLVAKTPALNHATLDAIDRRAGLVGGSRGIAELDRQAEVLKAELDLARSEAKPNLTLEGGYKRAEIDNSNTFIIGLALPLPFFNRNQGATAALRAETEAVALARAQARLDAESEFATARRDLTQLLTRFHTIDTLLLPKADEVYRVLADAYATGRITYATLLEGQRLLIELRFELNDLELAVRRRVVTIERLLGVRINP